MQSEFLNLYPFSGDGCSITFLSFWFPSTFSSLTPVILVLFLFSVSWRQRTEPPQSLVLHAELSGQQGARWLPLHQSFLPVTAGPHAAKPTLPLWHLDTEVGDALGQGLPHSAHAAAGCRIPMWVTWVDFIHNLWCTLVLFQSHDTNFYIFTITSGIYLYFIILQQAVKKQLESDWLHFNLYTTSVRQVTAGEWVSKVCISAH